MLSDGSFRNDGPMNAGVETSMGPTAVLRIGGIDVVTISSRIQTIDLQVFLSQGIDPTAKSVLVVKSVQHFRAAYAPIAREIVLVDSGGICSPDIARLKFTKLRRPIWPLDGVNDPYAGTAAKRLAFLLMRRNHACEPVYRAIDTLRRGRRLCGGRGGRRGLFLRSQWHCDAGDDRRRRQPAAASSAAAARPVDQARHASRQPR